MLRPHTYPELIGKALVLEAQPFETMVDDDQPWLEGGVLVVSVGVLVGLAQLIGNLLRTASLPSPTALLTTLLDGWQRLNAQWGLIPDNAAAEAAIRQGWAWFLLTSGYGSGWGNLLTLLLVPLGVLLQWLLVGLIVYGLGRGMGGRGTLNQVLGATALMIAPHSLLLLQVIPFVSVSGLLLAVWSLLILYRAVEVAHELPWQRAALVALLPYLLLIGCLLFVSTLALLIWSWGIAGGIAGGIAA